ncbi:hypothetical protein [Succinimonas sp.]|uniref:hypothetical protein n=1 Tax=Succinimonas sp. TaxID=1936151 RepID=UPI003865CD08
MDETKEPGKEAGKENERSLPEYCDPINFDEMVPMDYHRRLILTDLLSRPENLSNSELRYRRFLRSYNLRVTNPGNYDYLRGSFYFPAYGINNRSLWSQGSEIAERSSVTAVIPKLPGFLKVHVSFPRGGRNCFFRNHFRRFEPFEKQKLRIHVFEEDCGLLPLMMKEMSLPGNHICCYGIVTDPEIYDDGYREALRGLSRESYGSAGTPEVKMSFKGVYLLFMDAGNHYFQKLSVHNPPEARILEGDFSERGRNQTKGELKSL